MEIISKKFNFEKIAEIVLPIIMFVLLVASVWNTNATMDESSHIPAGYSYVTQKDMRINPEHPPLLKDLSALPLLFLKLNFPKDDPSWDKNVNDQWAFGQKFLYNSGNDADKIIFWARILPSALTAFLGFFLFIWVKKIFNSKTALITLILYVFSPTILAHGNLVTTDLSAAAGVVLATAFFLQFLENQTFKNGLIASLAFGIAMLLKFSTFLLIPYFFGLAVVWIIIKNFSFTNLIQTLTKICLIFSVGFIFVVWPVYEFHVWNYPVARQVNDTTEQLKTFGGITEKTCLNDGYLKKCPIEFTVWMDGVPALRPFAQYLLGFLMVLQRSTGGNTTFFLGEVSNQAWPNYFPIIYAIKESLIFHILTIIAVIFAVWNLKKPVWREPVKNLVIWMQNNFTEFALFGFMAFYWFMSVRANLNIGIRHLIPILPLMYILVGNQISKLLSFKKFAPLIVFLIAWYISGTLAVFPNFLSYFNQLAGGPKNGFLYAADSNLDWGQDLKRLVKFMEEKNISKISLDYFGGGNPKYYLKEKYIPWYSAKGKPQGWFAVSVTFRQSAWGEPTKGFTINSNDTYSWLRPYEPVAVIGNSIFVYYIP